jgi:glutamyl-tRNA synthetase
MSMDVRELILKHTLKNAYDYGKASPGNIVGKIIAENPEVKKDMKNTMKQVNDIVNEVNSMSKEEIEKELSNYTFEEKKEENKEISIKDAVEGEVVTRLPPEPNGWPHIGHAKAFTLSHEIARKYKGKVILRWDDTNPEAEKKEFVESIKEGIKWLGLDWDKEIYCSDYIAKMYELCEVLLENNDVYVCSCKQEDIAKGREIKKRCACGENTKEKNIELWNKMVEGEFEEGEYVVRLRGDMQSLNTVMRDPTLFRIIKTPHFRQNNKFFVWPTYDFQGPVMDSIIGITHPVRSKEYELRDELYVYLLKKLNLRVPSIITISRLAIKNAPISKRLLRPLVESGKLWGWDDPRLPTLAGLRRKGITPEAIKKFVLSFGISKVESEPSLEALFIENKKIIEPVSPHYFFVSNAKKVKVKEGKNEKVVMKLHPSNKELGEKSYEVKDEFFIDVTDFNSLNKDDIFRLKELYNIKIIEKNDDGLICEYHGKELIPNTKKIQWVSSFNLMEAILYDFNDLLKEGEFNKDSLIEIKGYCEKECEKLKEGDIIQFERKGFYKLDNKKEMKFIKID